MNVSSVSTQPKTISESLRLPPQALEAEQSVLGGLMLDNDYIDEVIAVLSVEDFYRAAHQTIFKAICILTDENEPVDVVTVSEWLENISELESIGGLSYLGALAQSTPNTGNVVAYARIVRERAILRRLITAANHIVEHSYNPEG
ncbi:MAG: DnaB-like helicase N-terminal domain-containing protein, partial [Arenicellales bacterium]|nr:DnaB-like helicase N-terminal domain-containing protein [Arenicellales bacterium]